MVASPSLGVINDDSMPRSVLLPAPFGPSSAVLEPIGSANVAATTTSTPP